VSYGADIVVRRRKGHKLSQAYNHSVRDLEAAVATRIIVPSLFFLVLIIPQSFAG
jgi:hypothetical protein